MFGSSGKRPVAVEAEVTGVTFLGFICSCFAILTYASHANTWTGSKSLILTVLLIVFEPGDKIAISHDLCGITFISFGRATNM